MLSAADRAMTDEGISEETRRRVINRVMFGDPGGLDVSGVSHVNLKRLWDGQFKGADPELSGIEKRGAADTTDNTAFGDRTEH